MSSPIITIESNSSPSEAADMMLQYNLRHLLVVHNATENSDNNPIGILTPLRTQLSFRNYKNLYRFVTKIIAKMEIFLLIIGDVSRL